MISAKVAEWDAEWEVCRIVVHEGIGQHSEVTLNALVSPNIEYSIQDLLGKKLCLNQLGQSSDDLVLFEGMVHSVIRTAQDQIELRAASSSLMFDRLARTRTYGEGGKRVGIHELPDLSSLLETMGFDESRTKLDFSVLVILQCEETDWAFVNRLVAAHGLFLLNDGLNLRLLDSEKGEPVTLSSKDIHKRRYSLQVSQLPAISNIAHWDLDTGIINNPITTEEIEGNPGTGPNGFAGSPSQLVEAGSGLAQKIGTSSVQSLLNGRWRWQGAERVNLI